MEKQHASVTMEVTQSAAQVFQAITQVEKWWSQDFEGASTNLNDEFTIHHPGQHYSKQKLVEVVPGKKMVWLVTDSTLYWLKKDPQEWTNTRMIFEISAKGDKTILHFTHEGLVREKECYASCEKGWNLIITDWLCHFITFGKPAAAMTQAAEIRNQMLKEKAERDRENYHRTILVNATPAEAMKKIAQVNRWWKKDFSGSTEKLNDTFHIPFGDLNGEKSFVDFVVSEMVPDKKAVWKVTNCHLPWFKDKTEWNNTQVVFEISRERNLTRIDFTHIGLVPGIECYAACEKGWDGHVTSSLLHFINEGNGNPQ
jgi:hypothetical protein